MICKKVSRNQKSWLPNGDRAKNLTWRVGPIVNFFAKTIWLKESERVKFLSQPDSIQTFTESFIVMLSGFATRLGRSSPRLLHAYCSLTILYFVLLNEKR